MNTWEAIGELMDLYPPFRQLVDAYNQDLPTVLLGDMASLVCDEPPYDDVRHDIAGLLERALNSLDGPTRDAIATGFLESLHNECCADPTAKQAWQAVLGEEALGYLGCWAPETWGADLTAIAPIATDLGLRTALVMNDRTLSWSPSLTFPAPGYVEVGEHGPVRRNDVRSIRIDPTYVEPRGRRLPPRRTDKTSELRGALRQRHISFDIQDGIVIVPIARQR